MIFIKSVTNVCKRPGTKFLFQIVCNVLFEYQDTNLRIYKTADTVHVKRT